MKNFLLSFFIYTVLLVAPVPETVAQCAMCKGSAEASLKEGNTNAKGLNMGIMYLLAIPYLLVGGIGYYWYTQHKKEEESARQES